MVFKGMELLMNIIHFNTEESGGAGEAAYRLHNNLQKYGHQSLMLVQRKTSNEKSIIEINNKIIDTAHKFLNKFEDSLIYFDQKYAFFNKGREVITDYRDLVKVIPFKPDAIVLNWISGFVSLNAIKDLQDYYKVPVFWHLMDMAPMTGGCHYAWDCEGYKNSCENCPATLNKAKKQLVRKIFQNKKEIISKMDLSILTGSYWTMEQVKNSTLFKNKEKKYFPVPIDENIFKQLNKMEIKKKYKIPLDKKVIYFAASNIFDKRKGYPYLVEALKILSKSTKISNFIIVIAGNNVEADIILKNLEIEHINIGYLNGNNALAEGYNLADLYLSPSIQDSGPMMVNESLMCGVPVIAFEMGVAVGLIKNGIHGYLAKLEDSNAFAKCILKFFEHNESEIKEMGKNCRKLALETNSYTKQIQIFQKIIDETTLSYKGDLCLK